jgi:hypothetical protein
MVVMLVLASGGCASLSTPRVARWHQTIDGSDCSDNLVFMGQALMDVTDDAGLAGDPYGDLPPWMSSRNDGLLGGVPTPVFAGPQFVEVRHREYLRVINGRSREFSSTFTQSLKRGVTR